MWFRGYKYLLAGWTIAALLVVAMLSGIQWLRQPRYEGQTMAQWLRILASEPGRSGSPLDIVRTHVDTNLHSIALEVPLSYALVREHDFLDGEGKIELRIDGRFYPVHHLRETNGNCLLPVPPWGISPGLHEVEVELQIVSRAYDRLYARGSPRTIALDNNSTSH
jgi:hypothetical protein